MYGFLRAFLNTDSALIALLKVYNRKVFNHCDCLLRAGLLADAAGNAGNGTDLFCLLSPVPVPANNKNLLVPGNHTD